MDKIIAYGETYNNIVFLSPDWAGLSFVRPQQCAFQLTSCPGLYRVDSQRVLYHLYSHHLRFLVVGHLHESYL
jgi:hypothetical protein